LEVAPNVRVRVDRLHVETVVSGTKPAKSSDKSEGKDK
jgi:hypothetical protein